MKYQWYIISLDDGDIKGSNDVDEAKSFVENEDYRVLSGQHGIYFAGNTLQVEVQPLVTVNDDDEGEDEGEDEDEDDDDGPEDRVEPEEDESPEDKENESGGSVDDTKDWTD